MTKTIIFLSIMMMFLSSCSENNRNEKEQYTFFKKQITPSGNFIIYSYARDGAMAFSSGIASTELFPINQDFKEGHGVKINGEIFKWISNDTLLVYDFKSELKQPIDTFPIKTKFSPIGDFTLKTVNYKTNSGGTNRYDFDSVWTSNERIYIRFIYNEKRRNVRSFPLGSVTIKTTADSIQSIEIFGEINKDMNFTIRNPDGTNSNNLPRIGTTWFEYSPIKKISPSNLNKKKIFYEN